MTYRLPATVILTLLFSANVTLAQDDPEQLGEVDFNISCNEEAQEHFELGLAQLHHMMYEQARPYFESAAESDPECAMAHWGIAMTSKQPLWQPTTDEGLERGKSAVEEAKAIGAPTQREQRYIDAVDAFFTDPDPPAAGRPADHEARLDAWREAQREVHEAYPEDPDAAAFYALAEISHATMQFSPDEEQDYSRQREVGALLERYLDEHPEHPGLVHYLIHTYDSPALAAKAEDVARRYDQLAPETPHALHMPSHIFVRLGQWEETVEWNDRAAEAALEHPVNGMTSIHYPHNLDYLMYAYLQLGEDDKALNTLRRIEDLSNVEPQFASAYGIAAAQARYYLDREQWEDAAELEPRTPDALSWEDFPAAEALFHYARGLGAARSGDLNKAETEADRIEGFVRTLNEEGDEYWGTMTEALGKAVRAWVAYERGNTEQALNLMSEAADLEDAMDKHPTTPGEILPVRELYGELLLREGRTEEALAAFEAVLERTPNRRSALASIEEAENAG